VVEQTTAELKSAGLAHLPSGRFMANAAWLALAVMAHNLGRAVAILAGADLHRATAASLRRKISTVPGRLVHTARRMQLRLPARWPWKPAFLTALHRITALPQRCCPQPTPPPTHDRSNGDAGRPAGPARPHTDTATTSPRNDHCGNSAVDPGLPRAGPRGQQRRRARRVVVSDAGGAVGPAWVAG
jgi:hypothetical protein